MRDLKLKKPHMSLLKSITEENPAKPLTVFGAR